MEKEIILVGDKVLIEPQEEGQTDSGLYLPQNIKDKEKVQAGKIIKVGPGYPVPDPTVLSEEPWLKTPKESEGRRLLHIFKGAGSRD